MWKWHVHECHDGKLHITLTTVAAGYDWSFVLSSWASLISLTAGASSALITVDHVCGLVARHFQTVNTKVKHCLGSPKVTSIKYFWSLRVSPSWMLIFFHFADTLLATSFIRSDSSGSLSSPAFFLPKPASKGLTGKLITLGIHLVLSKEFQGTNWSCIMVYGIQFKWFVKHNEAHEKLRIVFKQDTLAATFPFKLTLFNSSYINAPTPGRAVVECNRKHRAGATKTWVVRLLLHSPAHTRFALARGFGVR